MFPSPDDFNRYFYNDGDKGLSARKAIIKEVFDEIPEDEPFKSFYKSALDSTDIHLVDRRAKMAFNTKYSSVSLDTLFKILPGHYINVVCRTTTDTFLWDSRKRNMIPNPTPQRARTKEEIVRTILSHMNLNSKRKLATNLMVKYPNINSRSSKKLSINLLPATQLSIVQNQMRSRGPLSRRSRIPREDVMGWENELSPNKEVLRNTKRKSRTRGTRYKSRSRRSRYKLKFKTH